jgi:hypothetical protein
MKQMPIDPATAVNLDFNSADVPDTAKKLRPALFMNGNTYCCMLGPDLEAGVVGYGSSPQEALNDWNKHLQERIATPRTNDEIAQEIVDRLNAKKEDVW